MSKRAAPAATLLVLLALTGCTAAPKDPPASHTSSGSTSSSGTSSSGTSSSGTSSSGASATRTPTPALTASAPAGTPLGAGERVWAAFSQRGLTYDAWWAQLRPLLSDSARAVYRYDDPRNIPSMTITDKIHVAAKAPARPRYTAEIIVATSKGRFGLDLERHTLKSRWLLYAIKFPPGVQ
jgi:hypothetical protein